MILSSTKLQVNDSMINFVLNGVIIISEKTKKMNKTGLVIGISIGVTMGILYKNLIMFIPLGIILGFLLDFTVFKNK